MYKRPSKRAQQLRLFALYSVMTVSVVALVAALILVVANYGYNRETGTLEQRGLVQFASTPSGASVSVDGTTLTTRTSTKYSVEPGDRSFEVYRDGYEPWHLTTPVTAGSLVWLNYVRLVPIDRTNEVIGSYARLAASSMSPDKRSMLLQPDRTRAEFRIVDVSRDHPSGKPLVLPVALFDEPTEGQAPTFTIGQWDESGRYVTIRYARGDKNEVIVLDTRTPSRSVNISREFSLSITDAVFSGRSGNVLYVVSEGSLRKLDISGGTISRSLVGGVERFSLYDTNTIAYVARSDSEGVVTRMAGIYREGDETPTVLRTVNGDTTPLSIATSTYYGTTYTAFTEGSQLTIYKGQHDHGADGLTRIAKHDLSQAATSVEFNDAGSYVLVRSDTSYTIFGLERERLHTIDLDGVSSEGLFWIDAMHLGLVVDGQLTMRDIDGTNKQVLTAVKEGHSGGLSRNGTYFYSVGTQVDGGAQLQRFRMILQ